MKIKYLKFKTTESVRFIPRVHTGHKSKPSMKQR